MSALMISRIRLKDREKFERYLEANRSLVGPRGAELLFSGRAVRTLNGDEDDRSLVVVVRFPDADRIDDWFDSVEYRPLAVLREEAADMHMTSYISVD